MADETSSSVPTGTAPRPGYGALRWTIRITGLVLMLGGCIYLGMTTGALVFGSDTSLDVPYRVVISLIVLGLGLFVFRTGIKMLRAIDLSSIRHFCFLFALIYTLVLLQIIPLGNLLSEHQAFAFLLVLLYFGLSYWVLQRILVVLLLTPETR